MGISSGILVTAIALGAASQPSAPELPNAFPMPDGITLHLPDGWRQIPQEAMDVMNGLMSKGAPDTQVQKFDYAFQKWPAVAWFKTPLIIVRVDRSGRIADPSQYRQYLQDSMLKKAKAGQDARRPATRMQVQDITYDASGPAIWMRVEEPEGVELTAARLTAFGVVYITCSASRAQASQCVPLYENILRSVAIAEDVRYRTLTAKIERPRLANHPVLAWGILGSIILGTVIVVRLRMRRTMRVLGAIFIGLGWLTIPAMIAGMVEDASSGPVSQERVETFIFDLVVAPFWMILCISSGRYLRRKGRTRTTGEPAAAEGTEATNVAKE